MIALERAEEDVHISCKSITAFHTYGVFNLPQSRRGGGGMQNIEPKNKIN